MKMGQKYLSIMEEYFSVEVTHNLRIVLMNNTPANSFSVDFSVVRGITGHLILKLNIFPERIGHNAKKLYWKVNHTIGINNTYFRSCIPFSLYCKNCFFEAGGTVSFVPQSGVKWDTPKKIFLSPLNFYKMLREYENSILFVQKCLYIYRNICTYPMKLT